MSNECILCGKCLEVCPLINATEREELGPRAKADLCRVLGQGDLSGADVARLAGLCLGCGRCRAVCSQQVDVPGLVAKLREAHPDFRSWLWKTWLTHAETLWGRSATAARLIPERFAPEKFGPFLKMLAGLKGGPGLEPFLRIDSFPDTVRGEKLLLFAGCTASYVQGRWLMTALRLLDGLGAEVLPADFRCCGSSLKGAGHTGEARSMAEHNLTIWREAGCPRVVTFCASCHHGLGEYDEFRDESEARFWRGSLLPLSDVLQDTQHVMLPNMPEKLGYHRPCHGGDADADLRLLRTLLADRLIEPTGRECCGFGGIMRLAAPGLADRVNRTCWDRMADMDVVLTGCSACAVQLTASAPDGVQVGHWLEMVG